MIGILEKIRPLTHPGILLTITLLSIILWMPFGIGYYDWPWENRLMRWALFCFVFGSVLLASLSLFYGIYFQQKLVRVIISAIALLVTIGGIFCMLHWLSKRGIV